MNTHTTGPSTGATPHLVVSDGKAAIAFYIAAFGAVERFRQIADDGKRIFHCYLGINNGAVMLNDDFPEMHSGVASPPPACVTIHLQVEDSRKVWARAVAAGAREVIPLEQQPWGLYRVLRDPFGHRWSIGGGS